MNVHFEQHKYSKTQQINGNIHIKMNLPFGQHKCNETQQLNGNIQTKILGKDT